MMKELDNLYKYMYFFITKSKGGKTGWAARQPVLKGTGWVEDFNLSARSDSSRPARQLDGAKVRASPS